MLSKLRPIALVMIAPLIALSVGLGLALTTTNAAEPGLPCSWARPRQARASRFP